ncbi:ankyrin-3-like [Littorina saxatilis]|uniref:Uncharacterized protein n=1 Tax=Littorina saxatilis TaxID=31220 RepID=A0AAN9GMD6_9CAEN
MADVIRRLHQAIQNDDMKGVEAAVAAGADMDQVFGMQGTALCQAVTTGKRDMVALLLELGCNVNAEDFDGGFPLPLAIRKHMTDIALLLMSVSSCDVNILDPVSKHRPLCAAVTEGLTEIVEALVQHQQCNITQGNSVGNSALHLSLLHQQDNITKILSRCEGFRFLHNLAGHAPVHIVATLGHMKSLDILFPTRVHSTEVFHQTEDGEGDGPTKTFTGNALQRELNQTARLTGDTALHLAVREKHRDVALRLIEMGAATDIQNNGGQTALLLACADSNTDLALQLLKNGAPPNLAGHLRMQQRTLLATHARESSLTPLHVAASSNNLDLVKALCESGADVNICDERGRSPLYVALLNNAGEVAAFLLSRTDQKLHTPLGGSTLLHAVCQCLSHAAEVTYALLEHGCSPHDPNRLGNLPLHEAVCWENVEVVRVLLQQGASPCVPGEMNTLPLTFAARTGRTDMAALLVGAGADINGAETKGDNCMDPDSDTDGEDWSPLREALEAGAVDFASFLVEAGCDLWQEKYLFAETKAPTTNPTTSFSMLDLEDSDDSDEEADDEVPLVVKDDQHLLDWLRTKARNPKSLLQFSLEAVRSVFRHGDPPFALMLALPLPEKMIAKLLYREEI